MHADSDESNLFDWDVLSTTDDVEESDSCRKPFIDDEAIEETDRVDDEANDENGYDDDDEGLGGGDDDYDYNGGGDGDVDNELAEENDLKLPSFFRSGGDWRPCSIQIEYNNNVFEQVISKWNYNRYVI